jgi:uncharacterized protein
MNSSLYNCAVMHHRLAPARHRFVHLMFMFYLDLDEIARLDAGLRWLSAGRFNLFSFRESDHMQCAGMGLKESILAYLRTQGVSIEGGRIMLLTHLRTLGHVFNPVSFYFCFDAAGRPVCAIAEVHNTFGETKPYFLGPDCLREGTFQLRTGKYFYISPFSALDVQVDFNLRTPGERLALRVDDYDAGARTLLTALTGRRQELTDRNLLRNALRYPFVTVQVIALIHWHALRLFLKGIPYHKKDANPEDQRGRFDGTAASFDGDKRETQ